MREANRYARNVGISQSAPACAGMFPPYCPDGVELPCSSAYARRVSTLAVPGQRTTVHVIGKCPIRDCSHRRRNELDGVAAIGRNGAYVKWRIPTEAGDTSAMSYLAEPYLSVTKLVSKRYPDGPDFLTAYIEAMLSYGWVCLEHDTFCKLAAVEGVIDVDIACNATCGRATGPDCNCLCGGRNHGAAWDLAPALF